jgi:hypothetical protein
MVAQHEQRVAARQAEHAYCCVLSPCIACCAPFTQQQRCYMLDCNCSCCCPYKTALFTPRTTPYAATAAVADAQPFPALLCQLINHIAALTRSASQPNFNHRRRTLLAHLPVCGACPGLQCRLLGLALGLELVQAQLSGGRLGRLRSRRHVLLDLRPASQPAAAAATAAGEV